MLLPWKQLQITLVFDCDKYSDNLFELSFASGVQPFQSFVERLFHAICYCLVTADPCFSKLSRKNHGCQTFEL